MERKKNLSLIFTCGAILGLISFISIYGYNVLNIRYDDWLLNGEDISQHYLGWRFFRESNWSFPIGLVEGLVYPSKVSIIYTDSIPLLAVIFKMVSPILPETFQYFGLWGAFCFMLQGGISAIIIKKFTKSNLIPIISSIFFIFSPVVLQRMFSHTALAAHWLILSAIAVCVYKNFFKSFKKNIIIWSTLLSLAVSIHMYFVPMIVAIMFFYFLKDYIDDRKIKEPIIIMVTSIIFALIIMYILGAFYGNSSILQYGLGIYSANINSLFNSQGTSNFILQLPMATNGQYEGYAYLGLGIIILIIVEIVNIIDNFNTKKCFKSEISENKDFFLIIAFIIVLFVFAISPTITLNGKIIANIPIPRFAFSILSIFRSSGRFMWPIMYIIMFLSIINNIKNHNMKTTTLLLSVCCIIQLLDLSTFINNKNEYFSNKTEYTSHLSSEAWTELSKERDEIVFINIEGEGTSEILSSYYDMKTIFDFATYAIEHHMSINDFYIGRRDSEKISEYRYSQWKKIEEGKADENVIYIFKKIPFSFLEGGKLNFYEINDIIVGCDKARALSRIYDNFKKIEFNNEYNIVLKNNDFLKNGMDMENGRVLKINGISYGPYMSIKNGSYNVIIYGNNLDKSNFDVCFNGGTLSVPLERVYIDNNKIKYEFTLLQDVEDLEIRVMNNQEEDITISGIRLNLK